MEKLQGVYFMLDEMTKQSATKFEFSRQKIK